jgi:hypothetical protein
LIDNNLPCCSCRESKANKAVPHACNLSRHSVKVFVLYRISSIYCDEEVGVF